MNRPPDERWQVLPGCLLRPLFDAHLKLRQTGTGFEQIRATCSGSSVRAGLPAQID
ncbi:MAG: hypothetical protein GF372_00275 [Candidatus Marinimicrobia bacterium]|nr:hypothetical protein [Candidatus Neomarinimicrobiota bacterium]